MDETKATPADPVADGTGRTTGQPYEAPKLTVHGSIEAWTKGKKTVGGEGTGLRQT